MENTCNPEDGDNIQNRLRTKTEQIRWINGLKGLCGLLIFTHHFMLAFYPATYYGTDKASRMPSGFDVLLSTEPYGVIFNGNFYLCMFMMISAFLLSRQVFTAMGDADAEASRDRLGGIFFKRYPRLMLPAAAAGIMSFLLVDILTLLGWNYLNLTNPYGYKELLTHVLFIVWVSVDTTVIGPMWMLNLLFLGSYLSMISAMMAGRNRKNMQIFYIIIAYFMKRISYYYAGMMLGVMIAYELCRGNLFNRIKENKKLSNVLGVLLLVSGIWMGGYPSYVKPVNLYRYLGFIANRSPDGSVAVHFMACAMVFAGILLLPGVQRLLDAKPLMFAAECAYGIYLLHIPVIQHLGYRLMDVFAKQGEYYTHAAWGVYLFLTAVLILCAKLFNITVEKGSEKIISIIMKI